MQPSILTKILGKTEEKKEFFLALEIQVEKVKAASCLLKETGIEILTTAAKSYSAGSWEEAVVAADEILTQVEEKIPPETEAGKVILGLPTEFTQDGKIAEPYLTQLKILLEKLSLKPMGFVEGPLAITHFLQAQEGGPQSLILVRIGQKLTVSLVRVGKITNQTTAERTENIALDLEKAITSFTGVEVLPSRILLYDGQDDLDLEKVRQELINHPWLTRVSFLHFPKIEIAPPDLDIKAIASASVSEMPLEESGVKEEEKVAEIPRPPSDFGFIQDKDILEEERKEPLPPRPQEIPPPEAASPQPVKVSLPKFALPQFRISPALQLENLKKILKGRRILFLILPLVLLGAVAIAALWYIPTAQIKLFLESQVLQQQLEVTLNPKITNFNEATKEIPTLSLEIEEKGVKKTATTGKKIVGESARGEITIYNKTTNDKTFKKGVVIISPDNLKFTLDEETTIASASESVGSLTFGKQNARLTATAIGPEGNLGVGQEFHFADFPTTSYSARNEVAFSGGTSREISVVGRSDKERLLASASAELLEVAKRDLEGKLSSGEKILDKTLSGTVTQKKFDKEVDEETAELSLEIAMHFTVNGYRENDLLTILEKTINTSIPAGFEFRRDEVKMEILDFEKKKDDSLFLKVNFSASLLPRINEEEIKKNLRGKSPAEAEIYFRSLGSIAGYEIKFGRTVPFGKKTLPRLSQNIKIETSGRKE